MTDRDGCPVCGFDGEVAVHHDRTHRYYTHVIVEDGETFHGKTCSERTEPKKGFLDRLL